MHDKIKFERLWAVEIDLKCFRLRLIVELMIGVRLAQKVLHKTQDKFWMHKISFWSLWGRTAAFWISITIYSIKLNYGTTGMTGSDNTRRFLYLRP